MGNNLSITTLGSDAAEPKQYQPNKQHQNLHVKWFNVTWQTNNSKAFFYRYNTKENGTSENEIWVLFLLDWSMFTLISYKIRFMHKAIWTLHKKEKYVLAAPETIKHLSSIKHYS